MAVRRESVEIAVSSNLASVAARDAAAVQLLARNLDSLGRNATASDRATSQASRSLSGMSTEAAKVQRTVTSLAAAESVVTKTRNSVADATGRVRVAEQRLAELREQGKAKQSQLIAGEEALAKARRELAEVSVRAHAATQRLNEVNTPVARSTDRVTESTTRAARSTRQADTSINQLTGRLRALGQAALVLGPALVPIGSLAVPALTGLATQLGFVAASGGTAILAFQGVGDAVTAMNEALRDPTADNLLKARQELENLGPAAQNFVLAIGDMRDELRGARDAAAGGLFGELNPELEHFESLLDRFQPILREIGSATGDVLGDGLESLDSARWEEFFNYLETQARPTLQDLGQAVGDFAHGFAEVLMALDPASQGFGQWVADVADSFDDWAAGLKESEGLENFLAYIREAGPQVASTMGALATAVGDIVMAAQPLGGPVLEAIQLIAEGLSAVAGTQAGAKIVTMAAAFVALSKAMGLVAKVAGAAGFASVAGRINNTSLLGPMGTRQVQQSTAALGAFGSTAATSTRQVVGLRATMSALSATTMTAGQRARTSATQHAQIAARAEEARRNLAGYGRQAAVGAAGAAAFALAASDTGKSLGVQNTAMLGLMGSMAGPWGAAVGVAIGALIDFRAASDDAETSMASLRDAMRGTDISAVDNALTSTTANLDTLENQTTIMTGIIKSIPIIGGWIGGLDWFDGREDQADQLREEAAAAEEAKQAYSALVMEMAGGFQQKPNQGLESALDGLDDRMSDMRDRLPGMMEALNVDIGELLEMEPGEFRGMWQDYVAESESARGQTQALRDALSGINDPLMLAADSASQLASAMDGIFGPMLAAEAATDNWRAALQGLRDLNVGAGFTEMTVKGRENNEMTRQAVQLTQEMIAARVEDGAGIREVAGLVQESRREFIRHGIAAGIDADVIRRRANELGLTPKMVRTVFQAANIGAVEQKARDLKASYKGMPKEVRTMIRAGNVPETERGINRLVRKYNLTPKQKTTLVRLRDLASKNLQGVLRGIGAVDKKKANPKVGAETGQFDSKVRGLERQLGMVNNKKTNPKVGADIGEAMGKSNLVRASMTQLGNMRPTPAVGLNDNASGPIAGIRSGLAGIQSKTVTVTVVTNRVGKAAGGPVYGPGTATSDSIPAMLSNGEYVVKTAAVNKYGLGLMDDINQMRLAAGGLASRERAGVEAAMRSGGGNQRVSFGNATATVRVQMPNGQTYPADLIWNTATEAAQAVMADRDEQAFVDSTRYVG